MGRLIMPLAFGIEEIPPAINTYECATYHIPGSRIAPHIPGRSFPTMKAEARTVVVISPDDRFFGAADRVVRIENAGVAAALLQLSIGT